MRFVVCAILKLSMDEAEFQKAEDGTPLRRGWTTGACATAAVKSAFTALLTGDFNDPVTITLPGGQTPSFALAHEATQEGWAEAGIIKDAGDDPDVTHGATIIARVTQGAPKSGICFYAGNGVGIVTKPGLPLDVGEPAINPVPRQMITEIVTHICAAHKIAPDIGVTISVPGGEDIAQKTWNPRLGILGGISILGTTGIVIPYSCSAWIHSIQRGIDVARAEGITHIVGATGDASEKAAMAHFDLPAQAFIDMGDFVGGMLKYVRAHPVECVTIAGGFAKLTKLAQGAMDLHSARSQVDMHFLADEIKSLGGSAALVKDTRNANTAHAVLQMALETKLPLAENIAQRAHEKAIEILRNDSVKVRVLVVDRTGHIVAGAE